MLLQDSRREARVDEHGDLVLLEDQDRSLWDRVQIDEGLKLVEQAPARRLGVYQLQAAIASQHARAAEPEATDWREIQRLYDRLLDLSPSPVVALNRAAAVAMAEGPES
jgi:RNA polymerase sigma-70 factor, ECF subfamily